MTMRGIGVDDVVSSYRVKKLTEQELHNEKCVLESADKELKGEEARRRKSHIPAATKDRSGSLMKRISSIRKSRSISEMLKSGDEKKTTTEIRTMMRKKRKEKLAAMLEKKPSGNDEDPRDVEAIRSVIENMGDFKLKSDPMYRVPIKKQTNVIKKRAEIIMLERKMRQVQMDFNSGFSRLRDLKQRVVKDILNCKNSVREICATLGELDDTKYVFSSFTHTHTHTHRSSTCKTHSNANLGTLSKIPLPIHSNGPREEEKPRTRMFLNLR